MSTTYGKPFLSYEEQLALLKSRGMEITDDQTALKYLKQIGYYRLSAYWYPFRQRSPLTTTVKRTSAFVEGAALQTVVDLYVFDKKLRILLLDAIERIEIAVRSAIAYILGQKDTFAHTNPNILHPNFATRPNKKTNQPMHQTWLAKVNALTKRSQEDFIRHYKSKYGLPLPIWVSVEIWNFGVMSKFFEGMKVQDKIIVAQEFGINDFKIMQSWLRTINYVRNVCAHHSRMWNRNLIDQPKLPQHNELPDFDHIIHQTKLISRPYVAICIILHFMKHISANSTWRHRLKDLLNDFPKSKYVTFKAMGFPINWQENEIWK